MLIEESMSDLVLKSYCQIFLELDEWLLNWLELKIQYIFIIKFNKITHKII